jgi:Prenyltransferase and squalene oxidase repeat
MSQHDVYYVQHVWSAISTFCVYFYQSVILRRPVSYPGDPLKKPITRKGKWPKRNAKYGTNWKFACDAKSHAISQKSSPAYEMTGESAGRQIWYPGDQAVKSAEENSFEFDPSANPNSGDKVFRNMMIKNWKGVKPDETTKPSTPAEAATKGMLFYQMIQCEDGHWAGDYGGPMFLMPGLICSLYLTKAPFAQAKKDAMVVYLKNHQQEDGGWGTHIECASTMCQYYFLSI